MMKVSKKAIDLIIQSEINSEKYYNQKLIHPTFPGGASGITIGLGYDLGYNTPQKIKEDWNKLPEDAIILLQSVAGFKGDSAKTKLTTVIKNIVVPLEIAKEVFYKNTLPRFAKLASTSYPALPELFPDAIGAITSLVFNRGNALKGINREEMQNLVSLISKKDYKGIAQEVRNMKRIWVGKNLDGLITRREAEAKLIENSNRTYLDNELLSINE